MELYFSDLGYTSYLFCPRNRWTIGVDTQLVRFTRGQIRLALFCEGILLLLSSYGCKPGEPKVIKESRPHAAVGKWQSVSPGGPVGPDKHFEIVFYSDGVASFGGKRGNWEPVTDRIVRVGNDELLFEFEIEHHGERVSGTFGETAPLDWGSDFRKTR